MVLHDASEQGHNHFFNGVILRRQAVDSDSVDEVIRELHSVSLHHFQKVVNFTKVGCKVNTFCYLYVKELNIEFIALYSLDNVKKLLHFYYNISKGCAC